MVNVLTLSLIESLMKAAEQIAHQIFTLVLPRASIIVLSDF